MPIKKMVSEAGAEMCMPHTQLLVMGFHHVSGQAILIYLCIVKYNNT